MTSAAPLPLQHVNLLNPALLPKRESFTARHIAVWSAMALVAMVALGWWAGRETARLRAEVAANAQRLAAATALATAPRLPSGEVAPTPQEVAALEQALLAKRTLLEARRSARDAGRRGLAGPNEGPSAMLRLVAATLPPAAWITEVRAAGERIDVSGRTLEAAAVDAWLERLQAAGFLAAGTQPTLRIERTEAPAPAGGSLPVYLFAISGTLAAPLADEGSPP